MACPRKRIDRGGFEIRSSVLVASALLLAAVLPRCMRVSDGIEVDVAYQPAATPAAIRTDSGYRVRLDRALIVVGQVELIRCDDFVLNAWQLLMPARARAHLSGPPTSLGDPLVLDLMESAGVSRFAGTIRPPPGRYCGIRVRVMPADADAEGLGERNQEMIEHGVLLAGRVEDPDTGDETPLLVRISDIIECEMQLDRPLDLDEPTLENISIQIDHRKWFEGIDFALDHKDSNSVQQQITDNIQASFAAVLPPSEAGL